MSSEYMCNLVVPGAAKSGTSALHDYLDNHPSISMSSSKEPQHFSRADRYAQGAKAHNMLFETELGSHYFGESSTGYLPSPVAAKRISQDLFNPKAIFVLRDPVERAFSHYRWRYRLGLERRSFLEAVKYDGFGYDPERPDRFGYMAYLEFSQYSKYCPIWESELSPINCLFISSENLLNERKKVLNECFHFLGLQSLEISADLGKVNETHSLGRHPSRTTTRLASLVPKRLKTSKLYKRVRKSLLVASAPEPPSRMTEEERSFVENALKDDIVWYRTRFSERDQSF